jgi:steroid delta-isomerase-like uncharacterized protein
VAETETKSADKPKTPRPRRSAKSRQVEAHARSYFEAVARRDPQGMAEHWHPEGLDDMVPFRVLRGTDELRSHFSELFAAFPAAEFTVTRVTADDRVAAVEWRMVGTFSGGPYLDIESTGNRVELRGCDCLEVEDGKIVKNTAYFDGAAFARAVGMLPAQDSGAERAMKSAFNAVTKLRRTVADQVERRRA